ncbi:hypothetical protein Scep_005510 [Stephania cephalantha]|uniref:Uncharacterized protein n=1 Tax=Stephania cephalantha TaxID=152367 RepID=A0AAP0Q063_9MAGN
MPTSTPASPPPSASNLSPTASLPTNPAGTSASSKNGFTQSTSKPKSNPHSATSSSPTNPKTIQSLASYPTNCELLLSLDLLLAPPACSIRRAQIRRWGFA